MEVMKILFFFENSGSDELSDRFGTYVRSLQANRVHNAKKRVQQLVQFFQPIQIHVWNIIFVLVPLNNISNTPKS